MRTEKEIVDYLGKKKLTDRERLILRWIMETCETCLGQGKVQFIGGCNQCGAVTMCDCVDPPHPLGIGCS